MEGKAYADRGEFIEEEEMDARFRRKCSVLRYTHPLDATGRCGFAKH
jgi:hypothetical protein